MNERLFPTFKECEPGPLDPKNPFCISESIAVDGAFQ
jgi:hypothetical protein